MKIARLCPEMLQKRRQGALSSKSLLAVLSLSSFLKMPGGPVIKIALAYPEDMAKRRLEQRFRHAISSLNSV